MYPQKFVMTGRAALVVDPDRKVRTTAKAVLRAAGWRVWEAASALEALLICACRPVDLVLTEMELGRISGEELARRIAERFPEAVVVAMSPWRPETGAAAVRDWISKPFQPENLKACLDRLEEAPPKKRAAAATLATRRLERRGASGAS